jgi:hypothetical protein
MRKGTCKKVGVGTRCECKSKSGKVSFKAGSACSGGKRRAKRSSSKTCKTVKGGACLCKKGKGFTFAKKSRCR